MLWMDKNSAAQVPNTEVLRKELAFWNGVLSESCPPGIPHPSDAEMALRIREMCNRIKQSSPKTFLFFDSPHEIPPNYWKGIDGGYRKFNGYISKISAALKGEGIRSPQRGGNNFALIECVSDRNALWGPNFVAAPPYIWNIKNLPLIPMVNSKYVEDVKFLKKYFRTVYAWGRISEETKPVETREFVELVVRWPFAVRRDRQARLHCTTGPAVIWRNREEDYFLCGIKCTANEVLQPDPESILFENNVQKRAVLIEHVGAKKFLKAVHAEEVDRTTGDEVLWRVEFPGQDLRQRTWNRRRDQTSVQIVEVINATLEPDEETGEMIYKHYYLFVPPHVETVRQAVAWTFGLNAQEYAPVKQT